MSLEVTESLLFLHDLSCVTLVHNLVIIHFGHSLKLQLSLWADIVAVRFTILL